jgi:5-methyltetrahydropteroyltriglutamate--homocysteine methyltransferase
MAVLHNLGFPRIGDKRELKFALEQFWRKEINAAQLADTVSLVKEQRASHQAALDFMPVGDFSLYDQVLDTSFMLGNIPHQVQKDMAEKSSLEQYFAVARGAQSEQQQCCQINAATLTKWFDTNYHYLVPELHRHDDLQLNAEHLLEQVKTARQQGQEPKPVIIGPLTYLWLCKSSDSTAKLFFVERLLPLYLELFSLLARAGVEWVQIDEPILVTQLDAEWQWAFKYVYQTFSRSKVKLLLTTYFGELKDNLDLACQLPVAGLHIDGIRGADEINLVHEQLDSGKVLSVGIIDGRNIWKSDLLGKLAILEPLYQARGSKLWIAPSCSLLHVPIDLDVEQQIAPEIKDWMAFAVQKLAELKVLKTALIQGRNAVAEQLNANQLSIQQRKNSLLTNDIVVAKQMSTITELLQLKRGSYLQREAKQQAALNLPLLPTTTIGSFPQTTAIRQTRLQWKKGEIDQAQYEQLIRAEIKQCIEKQQSLGLDVFVHGEAERNDMVEYFAQQLDGFAFSQFGWVQSYGSRCVKPPILFGDISRPVPMTVAWIKYAQSLTDKPVKGMLTGPITMLNWSFVRDDQPRNETCLQLALAIRDEVLDLEKVGTQIIQIDEAAFREGLPLHPDKQGDYLNLAVNVFRLCSNGVSDSTQIHTHMCYSDFNTIINEIAAMDADVITIETSRSNMQLLDVFEDFQYPNQMGPGVYDIHSPNIPSIEDIQQQIQLASKRIPLTRLWINPDCGLKTRHWQEVLPALTNMVEATKLERHRAKQSAA